jgi:hypothetical protein
MFECLVIERASINGCHAQTYSRLTLR